MRKVLCLNMIVRNESRVIERMLRSVCPLIRHYCICDTGSTDDTCKRIESFFRCHHPSITGTITHEPFRDFAYNRNVALQDCLVRYAHCDAILLMDADMVLQIVDVDYELPDADYYYIMQGSSHLQYKNVRIIKADPSYYYVGATHEYLHVPDGHTGHLVDVDRLAIDDVGDGGCKAEKFTRDIALLHQSVASDPTDARALFYLANSYMDIGRYDEAMAYYQQRIGCGGWAEEQYLSAHRTGLCLLRMGRESEAIAAFLSAGRHSKCRLESLYELIKLHRTNGHHSIAMGLYTWAKSVQSNADRDYLFMQCDVYDFLIDYEYTIFAFYNGVANVLESAVRVLNRCPDPAKCANVIENLAFYRHTAECARLVDVPFEATGGGLMSCCLVKVGDDDEDASVLFVAHEDAVARELVLYRIERPALGAPSTVIATHRLPIAMDTSLLHVRLTSSNGLLLWTYGVYGNDGNDDGEVSLHHGAVDVHDDCADADATVTACATTTAHATVDAVMAPQSHVAWVCNTPTPECVRLLDMSSTGACDDVRWVGARPLCVRRVVERPPFFSHVTSPYWACMFDAHILCIGHLTGNRAYVVAFLCDGDARVLRFSGPLTLHTSATCVGVFVDARRVSLVWRTETETSDVLQIGEYSRETFDGLLCYTKGS